MKYNGTPFNHGWKDQSHSARHCQQTAAANNHIQSATTTTTKSIQQPTTQPSTMLRTITRSDGWMMTPPEGQGQAIVFPNRRTAARALALRYDMRLSGPTLDLLEEGIASVTDGHYGTFMHCHFTIVTMIAGHEGEDGGGGDASNEDNEDNEDRQPSPVPSSVPSSRVNPTRHLRQRKRQRKED
jgi:hypothetical protein